MILAMPLFQVVSLFAYMALGFASDKLGYINESSARGLSKFLVNFVLVALILESMQRPFSPQLRREAFLVLAISFGIYAASFPLAFGLAKLMRLDGGARGAHIFAAVFSNTAFMGYPVLEAILGRDSLFAASIYNIAFQLLAFSLGPYILAKSAGRDVRLRPLSFMTPAALAACLGFVLFLVNVHLPAPLLSALALFGGMTTPLSMVLIGAMISAADWKKSVGDPLIYITSLYRLAVVPALIYLALSLLGFSGRLRALPAILSAMPVAANSAILAKAYGGDAETASSLVFVSTLLSLVSIPLLAILFST